jgi:hypothetical protein
VSRRWIAPALALALLAGSALAFAYTERIKVEPSPVAGTVVDKVFSPVCDCPTDTARISFRLRKPSTVTLDVLDAGNDVVRTIVSGDERPVGRVFYRWDGRDEEGRVVPEGRYRPRVRLAEHGRTIVLPNPMQVDVTRPDIRLVSVQPRTFSPNGDGRRDRITARYEMSERAEPALYVDGLRRVVGLYKRRAGKLEWNGDGALPPPGQGIVPVSMRATDLAGNASAETRRVPVVVRYVKLGRDRLVVEALQRFAVGVFTDQPRYRWRFAGRTGLSSAPSLRLTAPRRPGRTTLFVTTPDGHADSATILVRAPVEP